MSAHLYFWRVAIVVVLGCLFMSPVAYSQSRLQYDFVDLSYGQADADDPSVPFGELDADIIGISGSFAINEQFFAQAGYANAEFDNIPALGITSLEEDSAFLGMGWHTTLGTNTDLVVTANYLYVDAENCRPGVCFSDDDSGYSLNIGLRALLSNDKLELAGSGGYADAGSGSGEFGVGGSVRYHFNSSFSGAIEAGFGDDVTSYGVSLRLAW